MGRCAHTHPHARALGAVQHRAEFRRVMDHVRGFVSKRCQISPPPANTVSGKSKKFSGVFVYVPVTQGDVLIYRLQ